MDSNSKSVLRFVSIGILIGLAAGFMIWNVDQREPAFVDIVDGKVIYVIQEWGKTAYIYSRSNGSGVFEFYKEMKPTNPYYPRPERVVSGRKIWSFNPKFTEWVNSPISTKTGIN